MPGTYIATVVYICISVVFEYALADSLHVVENCTAKQSQLTINVKATLANTDVT